MSQPEKEPKIIVDTDWKDQVAKEREAANEEFTPKPVSNVEDNAVDDSVSDTGDAGDKDIPPPPAASFEILVSMLFTQAMATLGQMPDPVSGETAVNKAYAKHYIDTLEMLGEKTAGNLSDDESKMLSEALHALRMTYVNVKA